MGTAAWGAGAVCLAVGARFVHAATPAGQATPEGQAGLRYVAGKAVVAARLRSGAGEYRCNLLLDFGQPDTLVLHPNAAGSLGAAAARVTLGDIDLGTLEITARDEFELEELTRVHDEALGQLPVAGRLGLRAFRGAVFTLDGPGETLRATPTAATRGATEPGEAATRLPLERRGDPTGATLRIWARTGVNGEPCLLEVDPAIPFSALCVADLAGQQPELRNFAGGRLPIPLLLVPEAPGATASLNLASLTPFLVLPAGAVPPPMPGMPVGGVLGGRALSRLTVRFQAGARGFLELSAGGAEWPSDEEFFLEARGSDNPAPLLRRFLAERDFANSPHRAEAAAALLQAVLSSGGSEVAGAGDGGIDPADLSEAVLAMLDAAPVDRRASKALEMLGELPRQRSWHDLRMELAQAALEDADRDLNGHSGHLLRVELGRIHRQRGELKEAHRQLLSAVFGIPGEGLPNLELGRLHEQKGELLRARGRYLVAMLDSRDTGEAGMANLERVHRLLMEQAGEPPLLPYLQDALEGRAPALHPLPRPDDRPAPTGKVLLVELFTGAHCPPCTGADMAIDALAEHFGAGEVAVVTWHLPIPAPEPLVNPDSLARAAALGIRATPSVFLQGEPFRGGGAAEAASKLFADYAKAAETALAAPPEATLSGAAFLENDTVSVRLETDAVVGRLHAVLVEEAVAYPGRNGVILHRHVARMSLTPPDGIAVKGLSLRAAEQAEGTSPVREWVTALPRSTAASRAERALSELEARGARFPLRPVDPDPRNLAIVAWLADGTGRPVQALHRKVQGDTRKADPGTRPGDPR